MSVEFDGVFARIHSVAPFNKMGKMKVRQVTVFLRELFLHGNQMNCKHFERMNERGVRSKLRKM